MDEKRQVQKELFEEFAEQPERRRASKPIFHPRPKRVFSLGYEHFVFAAIAFIIVAVVSFSLGVEKGKRAETVAKLEEKKRVLPKPRVIEQQPKEEPREEIIQEAKEPITETRPIYTIQVASYSQEDDANKEALKVEAQGYESTVLLKGKYYIICAGQFDSSSQAKKYEKRLKSAYKDCYIRKIAIER